LKKKLKNPVKSCENSKWLLSFVVFANQSLPSCVLRISRTLFTL
jgi:hypothetical protein